VQAGGRRGSVSGEEGLGQKECEQLEWGPQGMHACANNCYQLPLSPNLTALSAPLPSCIVPPLALRAASAPLARAAAPSMCCAGGQRGSS
jgi:hypothetical protein